MSAGGKDYVPANDLDFILWARKAYTYAEENHARFGVMVPDADVMARFTDFENLAVRCKDASHTSADMAEKKELRPLVEKDARNYIQGYLAHNPKVTARDRDEMKIPLHDTKPTPVGNPVGLPTATFKFPNVCALEMHLSHDETTPFDARANYGIRVNYALCAAGEPLPTHPEDLRESIFTRRKKHLFTFNLEDESKRVAFTMRYENSKGTPGQWSPIVSVAIP